MDASVRARLDAIGDCAKPYPSLAVPAYADLAKLPRSPGAPGWTATEFDIDAQGRPLNVHTVAGSGNAAFDHAAGEARRR